MVDKSELAIATSQAQNPIPFFIELLFNLLSQMITVSTIKLTSQPVSCGILRILPAQINSKGIDKLENLNREIHYERKLLTSNSYS